jgi:hypothetical protein
MALNQILIHSQNSKKKIMSEFPYTRHFSKKIVARFFLDAFSSQQSEQKNMEVTIFKLLGPWRSPKHIARI